MNDDELIQLADSLAKEVDHCARLGIAPHPTLGKGKMVFGTRGGLIALAACCLRAAASDKKEEEPAIPSAKRMSPIGLVARNDGLIDEPSGEQVEANGADLGSKLLRAGCIAMIVLGVLIVIGGIAF